MQVTSPTPRSRVAFLVRLATFRETAAYANRVPLARSRVARLPSAPSARAATRPIQPTRAAPSVPTAPSQLVPSSTRTANSSARSRVASHVPTAWTLAPVHARALSACVVTASTRRLTTVPSACPVPSRLMARVARTAPSEPSLPTSELHIVTRVHAATHRAMVQRHVPRVRPINFPRSAERASHARPV